MVTTKNETRLPFARAHVLVTVGFKPDAHALSVMHISVTDFPALLMGNDLVFEWFSMVGKNAENARQNCIDSIAFYLLCRPPMKDAILAALTPTCAADVAAALEAKVRPA